MTWKRKVLRRVLISLAALCGLLCAVVVLAIVFLETAPYFLMPKVDREIAAIKARGEPVTMADLAGPKIPDSENGAVIYERIFKEMDKPQVAKDMQLLQGLLSPKNRVERPELWPQVRLALKRNRNLIPLIEQAVSKPRCRFSINWSDGPVGVRYPHLAKLRRLAFLSAANALVSARDGNTSDAVRSLRTGFLVSESLGHQPYIMSQMVRAAQIAIMSRGLSESLQYGGFRQEQAEGLYRLLGRIHLEEAGQESLEVERACGISFLTLERNHPTRAVDASVQRPGVYRRLMSQPPEKIGAPYLTMVLANERLYLRIMDRQINAARLPYREIKSSGLDKTLDPDLPNYAFFCAILLPIPPMKTWDRAASNVGGDQVLLALAAYKDRFAAYPQNLGELRAKLGWKIPEDPFSGKDFIYRRQGKGFLLYSIGPDLRDDRGKESPKDDKDKGDMVWRMDH
jgi:hypothetical protein